MAKHMTLSGDVRMRAVGLTGEQDGSGGRLGAEDRSGGGRSNI
jgi:hypothetical protein